MTDSASVRSPGCSGGATEGRLDGVAEQNAPRVTEDMVTRASHVLWTEVNPEYQADPRDFTDADIAAGKLREADDADTAQNRAIVRRVLEAAFPDAWLPDDVRELLTDLAKGGDVDADVTMLASQLLAKYSIRTLLGTLAWWHAMRTAAARSISDLLLR